MRAARRSRQAARPPITEAYANPKPGAGLRHEQQRRAGWPSRKRHSTQHHRAGALSDRAGIGCRRRRARLRYIDFFTAHIRNPNTRAAYGVAVREFYGWLELGGIAAIRNIRTHHVSIYVELLTRKYSAPTVKQHLAAIRKLFDWLIVGQVIDQNPAAPVRGPTHIVKKGKTSVLLADEARQLLESIKVVKTVKLPDGLTAEKPLLAGLRDRALIALLKSFYREEFVVVGWTDPEGR